MASSSIPPDQDVREWLRILSYDLRSIRNNLFGPEPVVTVAAYHCQQAA